MYTLYLGGSGSQAFVFGTVAMTPGLMFGWPARARDYSVPRRQAWRSAGRSSPTSSPSKHEAAPLCFCGAVRNTKVVTAPSTVPWIPDNLVERYPTPSGYTSINLAAGLVSDRSVSLVA
jgi:hypothetical protein